MQTLKGLTRRLVYGLSTLGMIAGIGVGGSGLALVTATPAMACNMEPYIGSICTFAMDWCPTGYLPADGRSLPVQQNTALFALIGFGYGGDGSAVFNIPDLRGRVSVAKGTGTGLQPVALAQKFGQQSVVLNATQVPVAAHTHPATFQGTGAGTQTVNVPANAGTLGVSAKLLAKQTTGVAAANNGSFLGQGGASQQQAPIYVPSTSLVSATAELAGLDVQLTGAAGNGAISFDVPTGITGGNVIVGPNTPVPPSSPVVTQPPSLGMTVCIATQGLYPNRP